MKLNLKNSQLSILSKEWVIYNIYMDISKAHSQIADLCYLV